MWAINVYKEKNTSKILKAKVIDLDTFRVLDISGKVLKNMIKYGDNIINLELDDYGNLRVKNLNPNKHQKIRYYDKSDFDKYCVQHYCLVFGHDDNKISFIADKKGKVVSGIQTTIGNLMQTLEIPEIEKLRLFNAAIYNGTLHYFNGVAYKKTPLVTNSNQWKMDATNIDKNGVQIDYMYKKKEEYKATLPNGISHLEKFGGGVNDLLLPPSLTSLGEECFSDIIDLHRITFGTGIKIISNRCCIDNLQLKEVKFSGSEKVIGEEAFSGCTNLRGVIVTNAKVIGANAFSDTQISILNLLKAEKIYSEAFSWCTKLYKLKLPDTLKIIDECAFEHCESLTDINIPKNVKSIGKQAFNSCNKLKTVHVSSNTIIHESAFPKHTNIIRY